MNKLLIQTFGAIAALLGSSSFATGVIAFAWLSPALSADQGAELDRIVQVNVESMPFMGSLIVARDDKILLDKSYGLADIGGNVPNTPKTKFRIGSVTKQFTAACILLLEERGKLNVDDPISRYLPSAPAAWSDITFLNLLTHTSGIPNFMSFSDYQVTKGKPATPEQLVARFRDKPLEFKPGTQFSYGNSGYVLLGYLIERITGQSYAAFVAENIFKPLAMKNSGYDVAEGLAGHAWGHAWVAGKLEKAPYIDMTIPFSAGGLYSTVEDLLIWARAVYGGRLLSAKSLAKLTRPYKNDYALGVTVREQHGSTVIDHGGAIDGFVAHLAYYPREKITIAVLSNVEAPLPEALAYDLGGVLFGTTELPPTTREAVTISPKLLGAYTGIYELAPGFRMTFSVFNGQAVVHATGQSPVPVFAESTSSFFAKLLDVQIEFVGDEKRQVTHLILHQNGQHTIGVRVARKDVTVSPAVLSALAGTYRLSPAFTLTFWVDEDGHFISQGRGQAPVPLFAEAEDRFATVDAIIDFDRDASGKASRITVHQGGQNITGNRVD